MGSLRRITTPAANLMVTFCSLALRWDYAPGVNKSSPLTTHHALRGLGNLRHLTPRLDAAGVAPPLTPAIPSYQSYGLDAATTSLHWPLSSSSMSFNDPRDTLAREDA